MAATMSIIGLYSYGSDLFDLMQIPDELDRQDLTDNILLDCAELEVIYPDHDFMKQAIGAWSRARYATWCRMAAVLTEDYDPFVNIKRDETRTITETRDLKTKNDGSQSQKTNAYENGPETPRGSVDVDNTETNTGTVKTEEHFHVEGDSAITDAQDVMKKEVEVRQLYDIYQIIIQEFKRRFCLLVY